MPPQILAVDDPARACPLRFDADTICLPATCLFVGRYNGDCGEPAVAVFAGDGRHLVVGFAFSQTGAPTYLAGNVASQTAATPAAWQPTLEEPATRMLPGSASARGRRRGPARPPARRPVSGRRLRVRRVRRPLRRDDRRRSGPRGRWTVEDDLCHARCAESARSRAGVGVVRRTRYGHGPLEGRMLSSTEPRTDVRQRAGGAFGLRFLRAGTPLAPLRSSLAASATVAG